MKQLSPEALEASRALAIELGQEPVQVSATRWKFVSQTDKTEPVHYVDYMTGRLYCTCTGFTVHKRCRHIDHMEKKLMNDDDYPMTRDMTPAASFGGAVAVHRSPVELRARLVEMKEERGLVAAFMKDVMEPSTKGTTDGDYGIIPGTDKPTLFKPGAEKLCELYGYAPTIKSREELIDNESGHYRVVVTVALVQKGTGAVVAEGIGECNTREGRYFYRWGFDKDIPIGVDKDALKKRTGTGKNGRPYTMYRIENDDLFTLWNTVLKMAKKRALVDAVLSATRSSGIFSQSMEQINDWIEAEYEVVGSDDSEPEPKPEPTPDPVPAYDWPAFVKKLSDLGINAEDVKNAIPIANGKPVAGDFKRWLDAHPGATLEHLTAAIVTAKQAACEHDAGQYDEALTVMRCSKCGLTLDGPEEGVEEPVAAGLGI